MPLATSNLKGAVLYRRRATVLVVLALLLTAGCSDSKSAERDAVGLRRVTGGKIRLDILPSFLGLLTASKLRLDWNPPACSWRLEPPECDGQPAKSVTSLEVPIVGGTIGITGEREPIRGRLELAGQVDFAGPANVIPLQDLTMHPEESIVTARLTAGSVESLFLDGTNREETPTKTGWVVSRIEVKLMAALLEQVQLSLGPTPDLYELEKVGDLTITVDVDG